MRLEIRDSETFIPEWNENKKLPSGEQIAFTYKTPTLPVRKRIMQKSTIKFSYDKDGNPTGGSGEIDIDDEAPIRAVQGLVIANLEYGRDGKTVTIRSAEDLLSAPAPFHGLITEFSRHLRDQAKEDVPEKN